MTEKLNDITTLDDITFLVNTFYTDIRNDALLGPIFEAVIKDDWPRHLNRMVQFWQTMLLEERTYYGSPFAPHSVLPVGKEHFDQWLRLFYDTVNALFSGPVADEAKWRATKMAEMFQNKLQFIRQKTSDLP